MSKIKYKAYLSGTKWNGIMEFLFEATNAHNLELEIIKDDKGIIGRTIYFQATGEASDIDEFITDITEAVAVHNGEFSKEDPKKHLDKTFEKLAEQMEEIQKKHPLPPDTGSDYGKGFTYCLGLFSAHFSNNQADTIRRFNVLTKMDHKDREMAMSENPPPHLNYGKDMEQAYFYWQKIQSIYGTPERTLSSMITTWANGSSDHLYELECPEKFKDTDIEKKVDELRNKGLDMGHGFKDVVYTMDDFIELMTLTGDIMKLADKDLGIEDIEARYGEF